VVASQNGGPSEFIWHNVTGLKVYATAESVGRGLGTLFTNLEWARWMGANGGHVAIPLEASQIVWQRWF
jgi:glycosyltransferase involved in cell wall biosynthesis